MGTFYIFTVNVKPDHWYLDDDEFLFFGFFIRPVFSKAEVDLKWWRTWSFAFLEQDQT